MNAIAALHLLSQLLAQAQAVQALLHTAASEGRDVTEDELDGLLVRDDEARKALADAIAAVDP